MKNETFAVTAFHGISKNGETGRLFDAENVCAADFPRLTVRGRRAWMREVKAPGGIHSDSTLAYVDNGSLYFGGTRVDGIYLTGGEKTLLRLGGYLLVFPDCVYVDPSNTDDSGTLNVFYRSEGDVYVCCVDENLEEMLDYGVSSVEPDGAQKGDTCAVKGSDGSYVMMRYDGAAWRNVDSLLKISCDGIGNGFSVGDTVSCNGLENSVGDHFRIVAKSPEALYCEGVVPAAFTASKVEVERSVPLFDHCAVCNGRLYGVRRGRDRSGAWVSRIYASAPNDPFNFSPYGGGAYCDVDVSGVFTAICGHGTGAVVFSESDIIEAKVKNGEIVVSSIRGCGVENGAHKSVVSYGGAVYYKSRYGVYTYDGAYPEFISGALGECQRIDAHGSPAICANGKYYINLADSKSENATYVYSIGMKAWYKESATDAVAYAVRNGCVYALTPKYLILMDYSSASEADKTYCAAQWYPIVEDTVRWSIESGRIIDAMIRNVTCTRLSMRLKLKEESSLTVGMRYDDGEVTEPLTVNGELNGVLCVPLAARPSDSASVVISGAGEATLEGIAIDYRVGGEAR